jgi:tetratricopeptide (TPR) repeat protein
MTLKSTIFVGLVLCSTTLLAGCAVSPDEISLPAVASISSAPSSLDDAIVAKKNTVLQEYIAVWEREQTATSKDAFTEAFAAYQIGSASEDHHWSFLAVQLFNEILAENPDFVLARAWRGSARAIYARDYPVKGVLLVIPGPGFVRLDYVRRAKRDLNEAVEAAPDDPIIRLIRASTFINMPSFFGSKDIGVGDFDVLDIWTNNPASNFQNSDILTSQTWRSEYYLNRARAMVKIENTAEAKEAWLNLLQESPDPIDKELAQWHLK